MSSPVIVIAQLEAKPEFAPQFRAALEPLIAAEKNDYVRGLMTTWVEWKPKEAELTAQVAALDAKMQSDNQPKPHRFEIRKAP